MPITFKTGSEKFHDLENSSITNYIEKYMIRNRDWIPSYDRMKKRLSILDVNKQWLGF
jgi:hypothetical protein